MIINDKDNPLQVIRGAYPEKIHEALAGGVEIPLLQRLHDRLEKIETTIEDPIAQIMELCELATEYAKAHNNTMALLLLQRAINTAEAKVPAAVKPNNLSIVGSALAKLGYKKKAIELFKRSLALAKDITDPLSRCNAYNDIARNIYDGLKEPSPVTLDLAIDALEKVSLPVELISVFTHTVSTLVLTGLFEKNSRHFYKRIISAANKFTDPHSRAIAFLAIATILGAAKFKNEALWAFERARTATDQMPEVSAATTMDKADMYRKLSCGMDKTGFMNDATELCRKAIETAERITDIDSQAMICLWIIGEPLFDATFKDKVPELLQRLLTITDNIPSNHDSRAKGVLYCGIASVMAKIGQREKALEVFRKATSAVDARQDRDEKLGTFRVILATLKGSGFKEEAERLKASNPIAREAAERGK